MLGESMAPALGLPPATARVAPGGVLFLCPAHWGIRNVLHTGLAAEVRRRIRPVSILAGSPDSHASWYPDLRRPGEPNASTEPRRHVEDCDWFGELSAPPILAAPRTQTARYALQRASFFRRYGISTDQVCNWWYRRNSGWRSRLSEAAVNLAAVAASRDPLFGWQMAALDRLKRRAWDLGPARRLLQEFQPSLVVATSCVMWVEEPFLMAARELGIVTLGCIQSFDNLTSRSYIPVCDHYAVWNAGMASQLRAYYPERPAEVHVTGTPQFDFHRREDFRWTREATLEHLGLSPGERYLLYAANSFDQTPTEPELVDEFAERCATSPSLRSRRIVVRLHPQDDFTRWDALAGRRPTVRVSRPSGQRWSFSGPEDQARLVNTLRHADVCLNMWSTMSLDAAILDTPVVCVGFARAKGSLEDRFCRLVYEADFYRPIVASGGVRLAHGMDDLVEQTAAYVHDRSRDRAERGLLAMQECGAVDGRATTRLADLIVGLAAARRR
jgi:hypothetical protein